MAADRRSRRETADILPNRGLEGSMVECGAAAIGSEQRPFGLCRGWKASPAGTRRRSGGLIGGNGNRKHRNRRERISTGGA